MVLVGAEHRNYLLKNREARNQNFRLSRLPRPVGSGRLISPSSKLRATRLASKNCSNSSTNPRVQRHVRAVAPLQSENLVLKGEPGQEVGRLPAVLVQNLCRRTRLQRSPPRAGEAPADGRRCFVPSSRALYPVVIVPPAVPGIL
jgi:hypothetical protein